MLALYILWYLPLYWKFFSVWILENFSQPQFNFNANNKFPLSLFLFIQTKHNPLNCAFSKSRCRLIWCCFEGNCKQLCCTNLVLKNHLQWHLKIHFWWQSEWKAVRIKYLYLLLLVTVIVEAGHGIVVDITLS